VEGFILEIEFIAHMKGTGLVWKKLVLDMELLLNELHIFPK
jgi:hypothetical protein